MASVDPTGKVILDLRGGSAIVALVGDTAHISGRTAEVAAPRVIVEFVGGTRFFSGPQSGRLGVRQMRYAIKCVAPKHETGDIEALAIAIAVAERLHLIGPRHYGSVAIYQSSEDSIGPVLIDPDTDEPFVTVLASYLAAAQAVA